MNFHVSIWLPQWVNKAKHIMHYWLSNPIALAEQLMSKSLNATGQFAKTARIKVFTVPNLIKPLNQDFYDKYLKNYQNHWFKVFF